jgi:mRNA interferase RelE/StbE
LPIRVRLLARARGRPVRDALGELERDPRLGHELRGRLTGLRSYWVGVYRIIYELRADRTARVVVIRHRGSVFDTDPHERSHQAVATSP